MKIIENIREFFNRNQHNQQNQRSLAAARPTRFVNWNGKESYHKINFDLKADLLKCQARCRELAKNDPIVRSFLNLCEKNVIGKAGFELQMQMKKR